MPFHHFGKVENGHPALQPSYLDGVFHVHHAERTSSDDYSRPNLRGHLHTQDTHALIFLRFIKQHQPTPAAAKRAIPASTHLDTLQPRDRVEHVARGVVHLVVPPEITRVVVGVNFVGASQRLQREIAALKRALDKLADVFHRRNVAIVVPQCVVSVRIRGYDTLRARGADGFAIVIAKRDEQRFFSKSSHLVPAVFFCWPKDAEIFPGRGKNASRSSRDALDVVVVRADAIHEEERVGAATTIQDFQRQRWLAILRLRPLRPFLLQFAVRISAALQEL